MPGSRCLVLAAALAVALTAQGCNRDYKAPKPKTGTVQGATVSTGSGGIVTGTRGKEIS
jgi:hypothetical protein